MASVLRLLNGVILAVGMSAIWTSGSYAQTPPSGENEAGSSFQRVDRTNKTYCLSPVDGELNPYVDAKGARALDIEINGDVYVVSVENPVRSIQMLDARGVKVDSVEVPQYEAGTIEHIELLNPKTLWVGGRTRDYLVDIAHDRVGFENPRPMETGLFAEPSSMFSFGSRPAQGRYIGSLNGVWIAGYPRSFFGTKERRLVLLKSSGTIDLTDRFGPSAYVEESRHIGGVVVRAASGVVMFYDGQQIVPLPSARPSDIRGRRWLIQPTARTPNSRIFIIESAQGAQHTNSSAYEVLAGGGVRSFKVNPSSVGQLWLMDTGEGSLWAKDDRRVYREIDGEFKAIISSTSDRLISGMWVVSDGRGLGLLISISGANKSSKKKYYLLSSNLASCPIKNRFLAPF